MKDLENQSLVGLAFEEMTMEEMEASQGSGDVGADTGPSCAILTLASGALFSIAFC